MWWGRWACGPLLLAVVIARAGGDDAPPPRFGRPTLQTAPGADRVPPRTVGAEEVVPLWSEAELLAAGRRPPPEGGDDPRELFLVFESWGAGFNNERMSLEMAFTLALVWCRTLVLPPLVGDRTRPEKQFRYESFFDVERMRAGIEHATRGRATLLTAEEFVATAASRLGQVELIPRMMERGRVGGEGSYFGGLGRIATRVLDEFDLHASIIVAVPAISSVAATAAAAAAGGWPSEQQFATALRPERVRVQPSVLQRTVLHIGSERLLGNYYSTIFIPDPSVARRAHATLRRYLGLRAAIVQAAGEATTALEEMVQAHRRSTGAVGGADARWVAVHSRQGDFETLYPQHWLDASNHSEVTAMLGMHANLLRQAEAVYFATTYAGLATHREEQKQRRAVEARLLPRLRSATPAGKLVVRWEDLAPKVTMPHLSPDEASEWVGLVELLLCTSAPAGFIGSYASTFTGYIHRLRGELPFLYTRSEEDGVLDDRSAVVSWAAAASPAAIVWSREWREGVQ